MVIKNQKLYMNSLKKEIWGERMLNEPFCIGIHIVYIQRGPT